MFRLFCCRSIIALGLLMSPAIAADSAPVKIIVDTDMATDCDDAGALAVLHALADNGECEILATVVSSKNPWSVPAVNVINTYYGRPNLPIGDVKGPGAKVDSHYIQQISQEFPHAIQSEADVPDAVKVYRDVLEKQPDQSVVVATIGYMTNLRNLLQLPAEPGHVSGLDLIKAKVKTWVCMGGNFIGSPAVDDLKLGNVNFQRDAPAALYTINNWPTPIVFVGREVASVPSKVEIGKSLENAPTDNPVRQAYAHYFNGPIKDHHVADLATVLFAVRGLRDYWDIQSKGHMDLQPDMKFEWKFDADKNQSYLLKKMTDGKPNDPYIEQVLDKLLIQPRAATGK